MAKLSYTKLPIRIPPGPVNEATSMAAATSGNLFRYDATTKLYVFNWGTKGMTAGIYQLKIDLGDGALDFRPKAQATSIAQACLVRTMQSGVALRRDSH